MYRAPLAYNCSLTRLDMCLTTKISLAPGLKCRVLQLLKIKFFFLSFSFIHTRRFMDTLTVSAYRTISQHWSLAMLWAVSARQRPHIRGVYLIYMKFSSHSSFFFSFILCDAVQNIAAIESRWLCTIRSNLDAKNIHFWISFLQSERENGFDWCFAISYYKEKADFILWRLSERWSSQQ